MRFIVLALGMSLTHLMSFGQNLTIDEKVDSLLALMTLEEKIGQMTQAERNALTSLQDVSTYGIGSLLSGGGSAPSSNTVTGWAEMYDNFQTEALKSRLGIPVIYGVDAVHGHNNVYGAVMFPHNIGLGCTWNRDLVTQLNQLCAKEVAATGIDWTFSPSIAVVQNERWGRTYEGFGETAEIQRIMSAASVKGLQGDNLSDSHTILACAKHFVGDGGTMDGIDQGNTIVSEEVLRELHMIGYVDAIEQNVGTVMASYSSWNGDKMHGQGYLLTDVLKGELGFEGFVISDWAGVDQIDEDYRTAIKRAINAGVDMVMVPDRYLVFINFLKDLVEKGEVPQSRIDDAVKRILKQKFLLGLFEQPFTDTDLQASFGSEEHREIARQAVRESLVLLSSKNDILPLSKTKQRILVAGSKADDLGAQCGGWSIYWQGGNGDITEGTTILEALQNASETSEIVSAPDGQFTGEVDVAVVVVGENPYAEGNGDRTALDMANPDVQLVRTLKEQGIPVVTILISGRPMIIGKAVAYSDAFIAAWLPGTEGDGIADVLFGDYAPTGLLTHSWPRDMSQIPINIGDENYDPLYAYKHGLTEFPSSANATSLQIQSALVNQTGDRILISLSDHVSNFEAASTDFNLQLDGTDISSTIRQVDLSSFDNSILEIQLSEPIAADQQNIMLSYSGSGIGNGNLSLDNFQGHWVFNGAIDYGTPYVIPGKIEAENFFNASDVGLENTSDTGGGSNVGWIDAGDWIEYNVDVQASGEYQLVGRIASASTNGTLDIYFDEELTATINYTRTGDWQIWQDFSASVELEAGNYSMKVSTPTGGLNINYFNIHESVLAIAQPQFDLQTVFEVYPNPAKGGVTIRTVDSRVKPNSIKLLNISGHVVQVLHQGDGQELSKDQFFNIDSRVPSGIYFIEIKDQSKRHFHRIVLE